MQHGARPRFIPITRLESAVLWELLPSFGVAVAALTLVMVAAGAYEPVREGLPLSSLAKFVPLLIPFALPWTIPTAFVAACIMVYSRMAGNNELMAVRASGIHLWRVLTPAVMTATLLCAACGILNHFLVPRVHFYQYGVLKASSASEQAAAIRFSDPIMRIGQQTVHVGDVHEDNSFTDIVIVMPGKTLGTSDRGASEVQFTYVTAPRGFFEYSDERSEIVFHLTGDPARATLQNPDAGKATLHRSVYGTHRRDFEQAMFGACDITIKLPSLADFKFLPHKGRFMTTVQLRLRLEQWRKMLAESPTDRPETKALTEAQRELELKQIRMRQSAPRQWATEIHARSALSLTPLLLGAIAVPLGVMTRRGRRAIAFGLAIAMMLGGYYPLMAAGAVLGKSGSLSPAVAGWGAAIVSAVVAVALLGNILRR